MSSKPYFDKSNRAESYTSLGFYTQNESYPIVERKRISCPKQFLDTVYSTLTMNEELSTLPFITQKKIDTWIPCDVMPPRYDT